MDIEYFFRKVNADYDAFLRYLTDRFPLYAQGKIKKYGRLQAIALNLLLRIVVLFIKLFCFKNPPKYIFQGLRHVNLIKVLPPLDVMVIGGVNEFIYCRKMGYRFHWAGYLGRCFELFYFSKKTAALIDAVLFIRKYFRTHLVGNKYLFLWEDSQPIGLTLSMALVDVVGVNVVCIAHGYDYEFSNKRVYIDGLNSSFNLVYDKAQVILYEKHFSKSPTFELGLPYEVKPIKTIKPKVILVEHTGMAHGDEYIISMYHLIKIYQILKSSGYEVTFRARPGSNIAYLKSMFTDVYDGDKLDLFAEGRMVFVGFSSTLLFEAKSHGNIVIGLDTSELFDQRNFDVDEIIYQNQYNELPTLVSRLICMKLNCQIPNVDSLSMRFLNCIESIDRYNAR
jgi:hypothetical protein